MKNFKAYQPNTNDYELVRFWPTTDINISFPISNTHDFICARLNRTNSAVLLAFNFKLCRYEYITHSNDILEHYFIKAFNQWSNNDHRTYCLNLNNIRLPELIGVDYAPVYIKPKKEVH